MCEGLSAQQVWQDMKRRPLHQQPPELRDALAAVVAASRLGDGAQGFADWETACRTALALLEAHDHKGAMKVLQLACQV